MVNATNEVTMKKVENVLRNNVEARDNDSILYTELLRTQYNCSANMRATTLERRVNDGKLPSRDVVTRYRRYLQRIDKSLRGALWDKRQAWANVVRENI